MWLKLDSTHIQIFIVNSVVIDPYYTWKLEMEGNAGGTRKLGKEPVYSVRVKLNMEEAHVILQHRRMSLTLQKK